MKTTLYTLAAATFSLLVMGVAPDYTGFGTAETYAKRICYEVSEQVVKKPVVKKRRVACKPKKPVCKCKTISQADFRACGGKWYASTSEGSRSQMFKSRKGCICTYKSNDWSYVGAATNRTYLWSIWVGR